MISEKNKIIGVLTVAFLFRVAGIRFGLPYIYHQDEPIIMNHALSIGAGGWNTHFFVIPPFTVEFLFIIQGIFFCLGKMFGVFKTASDFAVVFSRDPSAFYLVGRFFLGVLPGVATVWVIWSGAKHFFGGKIAWWSALFLSILPFHVQHSHYIYADIMLTLASALMFFALLLILEEPSKLNYIKFGALAGWAISIKYTAFYFVPVILVAHLISHRKMDRGEGAFLKLILSGVCCVAVFFVLAPFTFLDWKDLSAQLFHQGSAEGFTGLFHHAVYSIVGGTGILFTTLWIAGIFFLGHSSWQKATVTGSFILVYYGINVYFGQRFARYMLPLAPVLALLAAIGVETCRVNGGKRRAWSSFFAGAACLELFLTAAYSDILFLKKDTRSRCAEWFYQSVLPGSVVAVDNRFFGPHLPPSVEQIRQKYAYLGSLEKDSVKKKRLDYLLQSQTGEKSYNVFQLAPKEQQMNSPFLFSRPYVGLHWEDLKKIGTGYIVINYQDPDPMIERFVRLNLDKVELVRSFSPYWNPLKRESSDPEASTAASHLPLEILSRKSPGPYLEVYRVKG